MKPPAKMIGIVFGCLKVVRETDCSEPKNKKFETECIFCKKIKIMHGGNIRRCDKSVSGGCICQERLRKNRKSAKDEWKNKFYGVWDGMMRRCYEENHVAYRRYGGRGISVCQLWHKPSEFFSWAESNNPPKHWQLDRIDNEIGYSPLNCRFVDRVINANNKSNNRYIFINGVKFSISEASRKFGIGKTTIKERLNRGWSDIDSVSEVAKK